MKRVSKKNKNKQIMVMLSIAFLLLLVFIGGAVWLVMHPTEQKEYSYIINADKNKKGLRVESSDGKSSIYYLVKDKEGKEREEFFNTDNKTVIEKVKDGSDSPFFDCQDRKENKLVYLILDISGSVVDNAGENFFEQVASKIESILSTDILQPGDQIRIRFLGSNNDRVENIDFTGPKFIFNSPRKNTVQRKDTLTLLDYSTDSASLAQCQGNDLVVSLDELIEKMSSKYNERKNNSDDESKIAGLLRSISSEVSLEKNKFKSVRYIFFTDGISTDKGKDKYLYCDTEKAEDCGQSIKELNMNGNGTNKAYIIWVKDEKIQDIFRKLFEGLQINFQ